MVLYDSLGYGSTTPIPGTDFAVSIRVGVDNSGPHSLDEVQAYYSVLRHQFPGAQIIATDLSTVGRELQAVRNELPVITQEIGDTWIYGAGSDPGKVARYREFCGLRGEWIEQRRIAPGDDLDLALTSRLILLAEHNWGLSTGQYLKNHEAYSPLELQKAKLSSPAFQKIDDEWSAKRRNIEIAAETLPADMRTEARTRLAALAPIAPRMASGKPLDGGGARGQAFPHRIRPS